MHLAGFSDGAAIYDMVAQRCGRGTGRQFRNHGRIPFLRVYNKQGALCSAGRITGLISTNTFRIPY